MKKGNGYKAILFSCLLGLSMTGCKKNPEQSIVKEKDFDNMVSEAQKDSDGDGSVSNVQDMTAYEEYKTSFSDDTLGVYVTADAKVDIPKTDKMSIVRVAPKQITQEFLDSFLAYTVGDRTLYDQTVMFGRTKADVEAEIQDCKQAIANYDNLVNSNMMSAADGETYKVEYQGRINRLQEEYEKTPDEIKKEDYISGRKLTATSQMLAEHPEDDWYSWQNELNPNGTAFYGVTAPDEDNQIAIYAQNNENYGNCLRYRKGIGATLKISRATADIGTDIEKESEAMDTFRNNGATTMEEDTTETANLSYEDAVKKANLFLQEFGMKDVKEYTGDRYWYILRTENNGSKYIYQKVYVITYLRTMDGVFVNNEGGAKLVDEWQGDYNRKQMWSGEAVYVFVNDSGVVGFDYCSPVEPVETVVDKSTMKSFDEVKEIFEKMVLVTNALDEEDLSYGVKMNITVKEVRLEYTRISEADSFDTGLFVPVWKFVGDTELRNDDEVIINKENVNIMIINAIDGTIIDENLGY